MNIIEKTFENLTPGKETVFKNLSVTPLIGGKGNDPDYLMMDETLKSGLARIKEISNEGSVPDLHFENLSDKAVLLVDGEELVGAKQNRVLNITVLVPAKTTITIPVSCVEAGRWSHTSPEFHSEDRAFYAAGRARKAAHISESLSMNGTRRSKQGEIWEDISTKSSRMGTHSNTSAMAEIFINNNQLLEEYRTAFTSEPRQVGAIFSINGIVRGVELFDYSQSLSKLYKKLIGSYALDAIDEVNLSSKAESSSSVQTFLHHIKAANLSFYPAVGEGEDIRISTEDISGGALIARERIVHLCAFNSVRNERQHQGNQDATLIRASRRRRFYRE